MELLEFKTRFLEMLGTDNVEDVPGILSSAGDDLVSRYLETFGADRDWIREFYQYYLADREGLKQDYTPPSLAKLVLQLVGPCTDIIDLCAGTGSLSLYADPDTQVFAEELDPRACGCLSFNYRVHGIFPAVSCCDVLGEDRHLHLADGVVSNPPFNLPIHKDPAKSGNWSFALAALERTKNRAVLILPLSVMSESADRDLVARLASKGRIEAAIKCPEKMFSSTSIPVCVLVMTQKPKQGVLLLDASSLVVTEIREQRGQYGGSSHTGRVYKKQINVLPDEAIRQIVEIVNGRLETEISTVQSVESLEAENFCLMPARYLRAPEESGRDQTQLSWLADQYNKIIRQKNACKLTINETLAKELHMDQELWEKGKKASMEVAKVIQQLSGIDLEREDYLTFTRNRELQIRFKSKEDLPPIFNQFMQLWVNQTVLLNNLENDLLAQMRDLLLPKLMSGEIEVPE